jgi:hypothetical protein
MHLKWGQLMYDSGNPRRSVLDLIEAQRNRKGVDARALSVGSIIRLTTTNSLYTLEKKEDGVFLITGGSRFDEPTVAYLRGSTWGGSCVMLFWQEGLVEIDRIGGKIDQLQLTTDGANRVRDKLDASRGLLSYIERRGGGDGDGT